MIMAEITKQAKIEAENLLEEAREIFERCIHCGMCNGVCPVFKILKEEVVSPSGHSILLSEKIVDKIVYQCNLCKACEVKCPFGIKISEGVLKAREAMVLLRKRLKSNEEMIENIRKTGNLFGKDVNKIKISSIAVRIWIG